MTLVLQAAVFRAERMPLCPRVCPRPWASLTSPKSGAAGLGAGLGYIPPLSPGCPMA